MEKREIEIELRRWFVRGCSYHSGIELLNKVGVPAYITAIFLKHRGKPSKRLETALYSILDNVDCFSLQAKMNWLCFDLSMFEREKQTDNILKEDSPPVLVENVTEENTEQDTEEKENTIEPGEILELRQEAKNLHKRQSYLHSLMCEAAKNNRKKEAYQLARELMEEVIPRLDAIYNQIREWKETGIVPNPPSPDGFKKGVELMKRRESLRTRILKLKKLLSSKLEERIRQRYENEILDKIKELKELEEVLENAL